MEDYPTQIKSYLQDFQIEHDLHSHMNYHGIDKERREKMKFLMQGLKDRSEERKTLN